LQATGGSVSPDISHGKEEAGGGEFEKEEAGEGAERGAAAQGEALYHRGLHRPARLRLLLQKQTTKAYVHIYKYQAYKYVLTHVLQLARKYPHASVGLHTSVSLSVVFSALWIGELLMFY
jgi:hypothetical protein